METVRYSLIIPVYQNEGSIPDVIKAVESMNENLDKRLEAVFVVDGSPDGSYRLLRKLLPQCQVATQLLSHSRNFGSFEAIRSGLRAARGSFFAVMAADLQEPPELVMDFFKRLLNDEADVVVGVRESRQDGVASRTASHLFWTLYRTLVEPKMPVGGIDMFGCNTLVRDHLVRLEELNSSLVGLLYWLGFRRVEVRYHRRARQHGKSGWTFRRKFKYMMDSLFSFSDLPVRVLLAIGVIGLGLAGAFTLVVLFGRFLGWIPVPGYATTIILLTFFGGLNCLGLGIIGSYVWRSFENTKGRPTAIVAAHQSF